MITIKNRGLEITVRKKDGLICGLYSGLGAYNLADLILHFTAMVYAKRG